MKISLDDRNDRPITGHDGTGRSLGRLTRRAALWSAGAAGAVRLLSFDAAATPGRAAGNGENGRPALPEQVDPARRKRAAAAYRRQIETAKDRLLRTDRTPLPRNGDEEPASGGFVVAGERFEAPIASFTKALPHGWTGEADAEAYDALRAALNRDGDLKPRSFEDRGTFDAVSLGGERLLANPEAALSFDITGFDSHDVYHRPAPAFASAETAAEMVELYWQALLRDVPFAAYEDHRGAQAVAAELDGLDGYAGPGADDGLDPSALLRGAEPGYTVGPHVSQFLYKYVPRDCQTADKRVPIATPGVDYLADYEDWLAVQNSGNPYDGSFREAESFVYDPELEERYIVTGRDLATYCHRSVPHGVYLDAGVLLNDGIPLPDGVQNGNVDFVRDEVTPGIPGVNLPVQHTAWVHKWVVHRRLHPEEYGGRVHHTGREDGLTYPVPGTLLDSTAVAATHREFGSDLLPQAYPVGCPTHPSFPAGHAA